MMKKVLGILLFALSAGFLVSAEPIPAPAQSWNQSVQNDSPKITVAQGSMTIAVNSDTEKVFEVYSITGQLVKRVRLQSGSVTIDLHRGCYIVKCDRWSKKVVVS